MTEKGTDESLSLFFFRIINMFFNERRNKENVHECADHYGMAGDNRNILFGALFKRIDWREKKGKRTGKAVAHMSRGFFFSRIKNTAYDEEIHNVSPYIFWTKNERSLKEMKVYPVFSEDYSEDDPVYEYYGYDIVCLLKIYRIEKQAQEEVKNLIMKDSIDGENRGKPITEINEDGDHLRKGYRIGSDTYWNGYFYEERELE